MKRFLISLMSVVAIVALVGCGGSDALETTAEKDELSQ